MAGYFAQRNLLRQYVTTFIRPGRIASHLLRVLPAGLQERAAIEFGRRTPDPPIGDPLVYQTVKSLELISVVANRSTAWKGVADHLVRARNEVFDRVVGQQLRSSDDAFVGSYGASLKSLRTATRLGIATFLEYPIAHHAYSETLLSEEARMVPTFSSTMQFHTFPRAQRLRFDAEIEVAEHVFVLSSFQRRTFVESGVEQDKLVVVHPGVDSNLFRPPFEARTQGPFRVIFVGQITQRKGISYLLEAFERAAMPDSELMLVGSIVGTDAPWKRYARVRHLPNVPRRELPALYASADVFVLPSLIEGFPLTALEAMACGLPVIVSENTFGTDVVTDAVDGYVVPIRDAEKIADRLTSLHADTGVRHRMGIAARHTATRFSWLRFADSVEQAMAKVLASP